MRYTIYAHGIPKCGLAYAIHCPEAIAPIDHGKYVERISDGCSENQAKYMAIIASLEYALRRGIDDVNLRVSSHTIVAQMSGKRKTCKKSLIYLHNRVMDLTKAFKRFSVSFIPINDNISYIMARTANLPPEVY
jgi:ribonuclease HI